MNGKNQIVIQKEENLPIAEDYFLLRANGFSFIEELANANWTDYNAHDPGITTLEALCYALSELGYRTGFPIEDLLTEEGGLIGFRQAFFTTRTILTNNPLTVIDFRKILIDLPNIDNGWLLCKSCYCETQLYAECEESALSYAPLWRLNPEKSGHVYYEHPFHPKGLYDILLELEEDPELGDLNDRKILHTINYDLVAAGQVVPIIIEVRFPLDWEAENPSLFQDFSDDNFEIQTINLARFSRDRTLNGPVDNASFVEGWRGIFYADFEVVFRENGTIIDQTLNLNETVIRFFAQKESVKREVNVSDILAVLGDGGVGGIIEKYKRKLFKINEAINEAYFALHQYRNLGEDFCNIKGVGIEDVAVCMDVDVSPDADIEEIMAQIYNEIELYFNPPVPFYTLQELVAEGVPTEEIFDGPALENGFIKTEELAASDLKNFIYVSDIINLIMDIEGVIAVKDVLLTRYNQFGQAIMPSERWKVPITPGYIPRLYEQTSRILFYKNDLPFLPRLDEAKAILAQLRGERDRPKIPIADNDFSVPNGEWRDLSNFYPIQYTFPQTYGISAAGLPPQVSDKRKSQAIQLKGYLMIYEQIVGDMLAQLANAKELFSLDEQVYQTYYQHYFNPLDPEPEIAGLSDLLNPAITSDSLHLLTEPEEIFNDRRNRFLDHLLARFGEEFRTYALMLYSNSDRVALNPKKLIKDKIRFLKDYPRISAQRAKAFNYKDEDRVCDIRNRAGLAGRISRLLGMETLRAYFDVDVQESLTGFEGIFSLVDPDSGNTLLTNYGQIEAASVLELESLLYDLIGDIMANSTVLSNFGVDGFGDDILNDENSEIIALLNPSVTPAEIMEFTTEVLAKERIYIVEHLLLRPKFPGDAVLPVCLETPCNMCGEEDPYSFRITYVMQGKLKPFSLDIDLRRFADKTIRRETPAHLLPKICWVGNDICLKVDEQAIFCDIKDLLVDHLTIPQDEETLRDICLCANVVFAAFNDAVGQWGMSNDPNGFTTADLQLIFENLFQEAVPDGSLDCHPNLNPAYYNLLQNLLVAYFQENIDCFQFNTFERAWCKWLEVNTSFNWAVESDLLYRQVQHLVENHYEGETVLDSSVVCHCVELLLGYFGNQFKDWIDDLVENEIDPEDPVLVNQIRDFVWIEFVADLATINASNHTFCPELWASIATEFWTDLRNLLVETYQNWILVSYRLNDLIRIFTNLNSIYPAATLHDCDDGSDDNPVRLNNTILGSL